MYDNDSHSITYFAKTNFRNEEKCFGIKDQDRFSHIYAIGKSGTGKSTLLATLAMSDIKKGKGLAVIDPHGDVAKKLLETIPIHRGKDVIYFNPSDSEIPSIFNPLEDVPEQYHHLVTSGLIDCFKRIWQDSWGPRLEYILRHCIHTLLACEGTTLLDIKPLLTNPRYRVELLYQVHDTAILNFWEQEFDKFTPTQRNEVISPILNKMGVFNISLPLRNTLGGEVSDFKISDIMDGKKIFIANLSKGLIGDDASMILGSLLVSSFTNAAQFRACQREEARIPFFLFVDECHSFINSSFASILAECRKYKLGLFLTNQYLEQLNLQSQAAIFGNVGTLISFRVGNVDAEILATEFHPVFNTNDLINLQKFEMYLKLSIDGTSSKPFSAKLHQEDKKGP
jgi:DNA helicase HerA-like ATPase